MNIGQIDKQLDSSANLWDSIDVVCDLIEQKGELVEQFVDFAENPVLLSRFEARFEEYRKFWEHIRDTTMTSAQEASSILS